MRPDSPQPPGQCYLVGGAVRDALLGRPGADRDWVVVGSTPAAMLEAGFKPVGRDFPVFLQPGTGEEFALARTERRQGRGHRGFVVDTSPNVTLEADLSRRDLRINAMAMDADGILIDPYEGQRDIAERQLRHVSPAFAEDPLRILRVARFAAQLGAEAFQLHPDTAALLRQMVADSMLDELSPERVWKELSRALLSAYPHRYFELLREIDALRVCLPELDAQFGKPQPAKYHPEIDCGLHTLMALQAAAADDASLPIRFAVLCHDFGKGTTPAGMLPSHRGHEQRGLPLVQGVCERLRVPKDCRQLALLVCEWHLHAHRAEELRASTLLKVLMAADAFRRPERLADFLAACRADARGRTGYEQSSYPQTQIYEQALQAAANIDTAIIAASTPPKKIPAAISSARTQAIALALDCRP